MIEPIEKDLNLYKNKTFKLQFRIKSNNEYVDTSTWQFDFVAVDKNPGGDVVLSASTADSPAGITIDASDDYLITIVISQAETAAITQTGQLYFEISDINSNSEKELRWMGNINLIEDV